METLASKAGASSASLDLDIHGGDAVVAEDIGNSRRHSKLTGLVVLKLGSERDRVDVALRPSHPERLPIRLEDRLFIFPNPTPVIPIDRPEVDEFLPSIGLRKPLL